VEVAAALEKEWRGITMTPYGFNADGDFRITSYEVMDGYAAVKFEGSSGPLRGRADLPPEFRIRIPGRHEALDAAAALALTSSLVKQEFGDGQNSGWNEERIGAVWKALEGFKGSKRRSEILGEAGGILFMDDYGHHPTAVETTLAGLREFYPRRRIVLSFMSHTYTRTAALLDQFAASFEKADIVFLHKIYASARENYQGGVNGETLYQETRKLRDNVFYAEEPPDAAEELRRILEPGDLFITMGAGENWKLGKALYAEYAAKSASPAGGA
jgi:UDP-N-acetylmuramate--alanine ligase